MIPHLKTYHIAIDVTDIKINDWIQRGAQFCIYLENEYMFSAVDVTLIDKGLTTDVILKEKFHGQNVFWHFLFFWIKSSFTDNSSKTLDNFKKYAEGA